MNISLSSEQRQQAESALAVITKRHADFLAAQSALEDARQLQTELDADAERLRKTTDPRDTAAVTALIVAERKGALNAGRLPEFEMKLAEARMALAADMEPLPDVLRSVLSPVFDETVADTTHELLGQFGDAGIARNAALQTSRVQKFRHFLSCHWAMDRNIQTAQTAIVWLQGLLAGELPEELQ